ncbi:MAG: hypothetical protein GAK31_01550 [Stenotrophomonas maltophilia]|uniref:Penicillin-binding C-terminal domain-containing protein n=1 Tax=Stenotrophomonas maltophilia TaxID=40324 RepID=A0A7V8FHZ3_STEMA|nr:MAG: hypothetical protein GAK31_01550 [Stenotrophomonas maltophilia]
MDGLNDGATLARAPNATHGVRLQLRALGSEQEIDWLLDGRLIARSRGAQWIGQELAEPGQHTSTALATDGAWTQVRFTVIR